MRKLYLPLFLCLLFTSCQKETTISAAAAAQLALIAKNALIDSTAGGITSSLDSSNQAYFKPFANITATDLTTFTAGATLFNTSFVAGPAASSSGLGPIFNNISCVSCHVNNGSGQPPISTTAFNSMVFRLSVPGTDAHGGPLAAPGFGLQLEDQAIAGVQAEGTMQILYTEKPGSFPDGENYSLRSPRNSIVNPYIPLPAGLLISARIAPSNIGLGLLQAVSQQTIINLSQTEAANANGIHGKPNMVWDASLQATVLGRFGWKANEPSILQQAADALNGDIGITSSYFPVESSFGQSQAPATHASEISDASLNALAAFVSTLAPPVRRNSTNAQVIRGSVLFAQAQCSSCHVVRLQTGTLAGVSEASNLTIRPYTDLLLHNMGAGLVDNRPDFAAKGGDWRTAPLWGIGLRQLVSGHAFYLHDGRARNLTEAILWHGGEAAVSVTAYTAMVKTDRTAMLAFLNSL